MKRLIFRILTISFCIPFLRQLFLMQSTFIKKEFFFDKKSNLIKYWFSISKNRYFQTPFLIELFCIPKWAFFYLSLHLDLFKFSGVNTIAFLRSKLLQLYHLIQKSQGTSNLRNHKILCCI